MAGGWWEVMTCMFVLLLAGSDKRFGRTERRWVNTRP